VPVNCISLRHVVHLSVMPYADIRQIDR